MSNCDLPQEWGLSLFRPATPCIHYSQASTLTQLAHIDLQASALNEMPIAQETAIHEYYYLLTARFKQQTLACRNEGG